MEMKKGFTDIEVSKLVKAVWNYKEEDEKQTQKLNERHSFAENNFLYYFCTPISLPDCNQNISKLFPQRVNLQLVL